jgi:restriction endonuclease S subunit
VILTSRASVGFVALAGTELTTNQGFQSLIPSELVDGVFLMFWIQMNRSEFESRSAGSTFKEISKSNVKSIAMNLPPLVEQKRIVDVVSFIDAYIDALQQQVDSARTARNAVLHELLSNTGDDWTETTLGDALVHLTDGSHFSPETLSVGFPYVTVRDVRNGLIDLDGSAKISEESFIELKKNGCAPLPGDVLFSKDGTVGRTAQVTTETPFVVLSSLAILRPNLEILSSEFLTMTITSNDFQDMATGSKTGLAIKRVVLKVLRSFPIMLPPLAEQRQIVEIVSSMDVLIQSTEEAVINAKALRSGLLSDLLSGEHEIPASYDSLLGAA